MAIELFATTVGSRAFGLDAADSDYDVRRIIAKTTDDLYTPFPENHGVAGTEEWPARGVMVQAQALDYGTFLRQLAANDLNAWLILMSNEHERGVSAQLHLRELAIDHLLDSAKLLSVARRRAVAMVNEAQSKGSGKIAANGLAHLIFALNMGRRIPSPACNLGTHRDVLREVKFNYSPIATEALLNQLLKAEPTYAWYPDPEHSYVNMRFLDYYRQWVE